MVERLDRARDLVRRASDVTDDADVREQLRSIDVGLGNVEEGNREDSPGSDPAQEGDRIEEVEEQLAQLMDDVGHPSRTHIEDARDQLDAYRRERTRDW